ncbi:RNA ligase-domain-containing protein [Lipomyces tetrasporus]|uniref:RNA ligase-domain-containing protein n=1 Tax=Lipomyces tetrasporus TaxID=54092 RepID=A0AAD7QN60_9ASCO|nr:RNA ligase-domain-containing protein [Lipomyces tetrasporus]KAJ8098264.1 RNA ligase-domain-containing protein [Lipomyces tetrasporus]
MSGARSHETQQSYAFSSSASQRCQAPGKIVDLPFPKFQIPANAVQESAELFDLLQRPKSPTGESRKSKTRVKHSVFKLPHSPLEVHGWKFNDWEYKKGTLPTYARGLFSVMNGEKRMEIVARGYDKFFNIDETAETKWSWIEEHTLAPYYLTQKENGCIIFLSGLPDGDLLVCSKHSTGVRTNDAGESHAEVGERWVEKHLASVGLTKRDLAATLRSLHCTAVAELCDDSFEEHILAYQGNRAGLYLHGLNLNLPEFRTYPFEAVCQFAEYFGMIPTKYTTAESVKELRQFLERCGETGSWDATDVEGFVVRCQTVRPNASGPSDFFFKYKFEEPYLMYRGWREVTKQLLAGHPIRIKKHKKITEEYVKFARSYFRGKNDIAKQYQQNHGIITLRNAFLKHYGKDGAQIIRDEADNESDDELIVKNDNSDSETETVAQEGDLGGTLADLKYVIVPVATIGCGKTTLSLALAEIFGWGHIQNDNIPKSKAGGGRRFCEEIRETLRTRQVSIADRNNHMKREREQIYSDMTSLMPTEDIRFIAMHFVHQGPEGKDHVREVTMNRVLARGDNHQSIQASTDTRKKVEGIMNGFLARFQSVNMNAQPDKGIFDLVINLEVDKPLEDNLKYIIDKISAKFPAIIPEKPSDEFIRNAIQKALEYVPETKKFMPSTKKNKPTTEQSQKAKDIATSAKKQQSILSYSKNEANEKHLAQSKPLKKKSAVNYFALKIPNPEELVERLEKLLKDNGADIAFLRQLKHTDRIQKELHVTLMHMADMDTDPLLWNFYHNHMMNGTLDTMSADVHILAAFWDERLMCVAVKVVPNQPTEGHDRLRLIGGKVFHITIGTADKSIKPFESNFLLKNLMNDKEGTVAHSCSLSDENFVFKNLKPVALL